MSTPLFATSVIAATVVPAGGTALNLGGTFNHMKLIIAIRTALAQYRADKARQLEIARSLGLESPDSVGSLSVDKDSRPVLADKVVGASPVTPALAKEIRLLSRRVRLADAMRTAGFALGSLAQLADAYEAAAARVAELEATKPATKPATK